MKNIFDTKNIDDLPKELVKELRITSKLNSEILCLFKEAGGVLDLSGVLVGFYRKYNIVKTRQYMMAACYRLVKKGFLQPTKNKGEYKITKLGLSLCCDE